MELFGTFITKNIPNKNQKICWKQVYALKSQMISKGLFGILGFFQKTNEQIRFLVLLGKKT